MSFSTSTAAAVVSQQVNSHIYWRRLLIDTPLFQQQLAPTPLLSGNTDGASVPFTGNESFDANVVMILSVLLCAVICSLALNSIIRCVLRCSRLATSESSESSSPHLADTGINKKDLKTFPVLNYSAELKLPGLDAECVICLSEFVRGQRVKVLPKCNHGFHVRCIDRWLTSHSSCPTCRNCLIQTCHKIVDCSMPANTSQQTTLHPVSINITVVPLDAEGVIRSYHT
ncbi:RING-type E3 ubiquitin transferase [Heracleum sosnowskyi]|uniref:RING-type E3 ubiquitin transferase n=1 Tax=Heracleum sosnowskyi TaxID=360622 RepID=A0AAD8N6X3_9APIA|nr:RING-type E3 ubiquitin transferase [Heracleum sosnowskyi]